MNTGDILIYQNSEDNINTVTFNRHYFHISLRNFRVVLKIVYQPHTATLTIIFNKIFVNSKNCYTFITNNTCHASHLNSAPGQVFAFIGYRFSKF